MNGCSLVEKEAAENKIRKEGKIRMHQSGTSINHKLFGKRNP
jgi:hypothetical protein